MDKRNFDELDRHNWEFQKDEMRRMARETEPAVAALLELKRRQLYLVDFESWDGFCDARVPSELRCVVRLLFPEAFDELFDWRPGDDRLLEEPS